MPKKTKKRGALLTIWLIFMLIGNFLTAISYFIIANNLGNWPELLKIYYHIPLVVFYIYGILALANFIFVIFLFMWKKWAFFALCISAVIVFITNIGMSLNYVTSIMGLFGPVILYLILKRKWHLLK